MDNKSLKYRPDVDGLRAIAVLLVVVFHLQIQQFSGGFIGVDVFFVISGYLITGVIAGQLEKSRFSIAGFYERRARRILPALFAMLLVSTLVAYFLLLPSEMVAYAKSLLAATFSYSNIFFYWTADYFDGPAVTKPLLHTWSLAVEEQFYLVFPLILIVCKRWPQARRNLLVMGIAVASLAFSIWQVYASPTGAFYLPFSRTWELLTGSLLSLRVFPELHRRWVREICSIAGILAIGLAGLRFTSTTPFPGLAALLPCVGAYLLIASGTHGSTAVGRILSSAPFRYVGLASYSIYLWHWPLIVFTKMGFLPILPHRHLTYAIAITALSIAIGFISWAFIEQPFRIGRLQAERHRILYASLAMLLLVAGIASFVLVEKGFPSRFPPRSLAVASLIDTPQKTQMGTCFITTKYKFSQYRPDLCLNVDPTHPNYLLLGDSHSAVLWLALKKLMPSDNILQASVSGCKPTVDPTGHGDCAAMMRYIFGQFLPTHHIDGIFLTARWSSEQDFEHSRSIALWSQQHNIPLYVFGPVMEYDAPLPKLLAFSIANKDPGLTDRHMSREFFALDGAIQNATLSGWHAKYISLLSEQCKDFHCEVYSDTKSENPLMTDDNHLSNDGAVVLLSRLQASSELPR